MYSALAYKHWELACNDSSHEFAQAVPDFCQSLVVYTCPEDFLVCFFACLGEAGLCVPSWAYSYSNFCCVRLDAMDRVVGLHPRCYYAGDVLELSHCVPSAARLGARSRWLPHRFEPVLRIFCHAFSLFGSTYFRILRGNLVSERLVRPCEIV